MFFTVFVWSFLISTLISIAIVELNYKSFADTIHLLIYFLKTEGSIIKEHGFGVIVSHELLENGAKSHIVDFNFTEYCLWIACLTLYIFLILFIIVKVCQTCKKCMKNK